MHRKSNRRANGILIALAAAIGIVLFGALLSVEPWVLVMLFVAVLVGGWLVAANGMTGSP